MKALSGIRYSLAAGLMAVGSAVFANPGLAEKKNCMGCHSVADKKVGPSFKDVAAKYGAGKDAVDMLTVKIMRGGAGGWGPVPMPANPQVSEPEAKQLAQWILGLK